MMSIYNRISGQSLERLAALSDGVFAIAMTLLVLDLRVPVGEAIQSEGGLWEALVKLSPSLIAYLMSFLTLGIFWLAQQTQLTYLAGSNRRFTWIHLGFLLMVSLIPFSTALLAAFITYRLAVVIYWLNILLLGVMLFLGIWYAERSGLVPDDGSAEVPDHPGRKVTHVFRRRLITAQSLYAFATLFCLINTYLSIGLIVLIQLYFAISPRIPLPDRLKKN